MPALREIVESLGRVDVETYLQSSNVVFTPGPGADGDLGEIRVETADRATGYWTTRSDRDPGLNARTAGVYLRADPSDLEVLDGGSEKERAELIAQRLREWKSAANAF